MLTKTERLLGLAQQRQSDTSWPDYRQVGDFRDGVYECNHVSPSVLILDDLGLRPLQGDEPIDLYEVIRARYERGSLIITSNRALEEWYPLFRDDLMASAAMDRLLHHAHVVTMEGNSFRNPPRGGKKSKGP